MRSEWFEASDENGDDYGYTKVLGRFVPLIVMMSPKGGMTDELWPLYIEQIIRLTWGKLDQVYGPQAYVAALGTKEREAAMAARRDDGQIAALHGDGFGARFTKPSVETLEKCDADYLLGIPNGSAKTNSQDLKTFGILKGGRGSRTGGEWGIEKRKWAKAHPGEEIGKANFLGIFMRTMHRVQTQTNEQSAFTAMGFDSRTQVWSSTMLSDPDVRRNTVAAERAAAARAKFLAAQSDAAAASNSSGGGGGGGGGGGSAPTQEEEEEEEAAESDDGVDYNSLDKLSKEFFLTRRVKVSSGKLHAVCKYSLSNYRNYRNLSYSSMRIVLQARRRSTLACSSQRSRPSSWRRRRCGRRKPPTNRSG